MATRGYIKMAFAAIAAMAGDIGMAMSVNPLYAKESKDISPTYKRQQPQKSWRQGKKFKSQKQRSNRRKAVKRSKSS